MAFRSMISQQNSPISDAVKEFTRPVNDAVDSDDDVIEGLLWQSCRDLISLAASTPHKKQERLVEFIQELRKEPSPKKESGESLNIWGEPLEWITLPLFGPSIRESWDDAPNESETGDQEGWVNQNAFVARLTALSKPSDALDFSLYGIWALRSALEEPTPESALPPKSVLKAAAVWMVYAASTLREMSRDGRVYDGKIAREGESLRGKNWRGCSGERWGVWKERSEVVSGRCEDKDTKKLLQEAIAKMKES